MKIVTLLAALCIATSVNADGDIDLVDPSSLKALPPGVGDDLKRKNCRIPAPRRLDFGGFIQGEFASPEQTDLAVICVKDMVAEIRVYWGGPVQCPPALPSFGQFIGRADAEQVAYYLSSEGTFLDFAMDHLGIDDHYLGKASIVWYCRDGRWVDLGGAD